MDFDPTADINLNGLSEVISMMESINSDNQPLLFKICSGQATESEQEQWIKDNISNTIKKEEQEEILSLLASAFNFGKELSKKIDTETPNEELENKINQVLEKLGS